MSQWRLPLFLPVLALAACDGPPPAPLVVTTDGKAIAELCDVPESMFSGGTKEPTVTLSPRLTREQLTCTLREVRRSIPGARIIEAGSKLASNPN